MLCQRQNLILASDFPYIVAVDSSNLIRAHRWCLRRFGGDVYWRTDYTNSLNQKSINSFWTFFNGIFYFKEATASVVEFKINFG